MSLAEELVKGAVDRVVAKPPEKDVMPPPSTPEPPPVVAAPPVTPPIALQPNPPAMPIIDPLKLPKEVSGVVIPTAPVKPAITPDTPSDTELEAYEKGLPEGERQKFNARVRVTMKAMNEKMKTLETELTKAKTGQPSVESAKELERLQTELKVAHDAQTELDNRIGRYDLKATRAFKEKFDIPEAQLTKRIKDVLVGFKVDAPEEILQEALTKDGAELITMLNDKATPAVAILEPLVVQLKSLRAGAEQVLSNHATVLHQMQEQQQIQLLEQTKAQRESLYNASMQERIEKGDFLIREFPGADEWNKNIGIVKQMAKAFFDTNDAKMQASAFVMAAQYPVLKDMFSKLTSAYDVLQKEYQALTGMRPSIGGDTPPSAPANKGDGSTTPEGAAQWILGQLKK